MVASLFVILFFAVIGLVLFLQKDDEYDERQTAIMDRGGRYGLLTVLLLNAVFYIFSVFDSVPELSVRFTFTMSIWSGVSFLIFGISCFCIALMIILRNHLDSNEEGDL